MLEKLHIVVGEVRSPVLTNSASGADEAVVFVHGNPGSGDDWVPLLEEVAAFARVIAPDMPGFGDTEQRTKQDFTVPSQAQHLEGIIDQLGVTRAHLVLHDFGGPWGLAWAATHPQQVASVTLIDTGINRNAHWHGFARLWRTRFVGELVQLMMTRRVNRAIIGRKNPALPENWLNQIVDHAAPLGTKRAVLQMYRSLDLAALEGSLTGPLRDLEVPSLVVWGADDPFIPAEFARRQLASFPCARVEIVPGTGHWPWLDAPDKVTDIVLPFLRAQFDDAPSDAAGVSGRGVPTTTVGH
ncbi:alpha/beta hydrolase [Rhodococcus oxybenzonivorans]|uniref:alpha/beta fold hydrolase n=1 Tax=Rhodococcus TaxID=1827 RepID=UPI0013204FBE|nr:MULTISPECIES: alpha/beta hydrolase [Rhodococcus]MDV7354635.1 alpha/beta hydrolase [Rhodococcus oxybenzonivorans]QHE70911.1 alpha/beta hydrolase, putative [Rhodococcus sp. WAY2]